MTTLAASAPDMNKNPAAIFYACRLFPGMCTRVPESFNFIEFSWQAAAAAAATATS